MASSTVEQVQFPLLQHWADYIYRPCTIPYRFPSDPPHQATRTEVLWLEVFRKSIPSFRSGFFLILLLFPAVWFPLLQMVLINCAEFLEGGNNNVQEAGRAWRYCSRRFWESWKIRSSVCLLFLLLLSCWLSFFYSPIYAISPGLNQGFIDLSFFWNSTIWKQVLCALHKQISELVVWCSPKPHKQFFHSYVSMAWHTISIARQRKLSTFSFYRFNPFCQYVANISRTQMTYRVRHPCQRFMLWDLRGRAQAPQHNPLIDVPYLA